MRQMLAGSFVGLLLAMVGLSGCSLNSRTHNLAGSRFVTDVWPVFEAHCLACHGPYYQLAGLSLETAESIRRGSKNGPIIKPGKPESSELFRRISLAEKDSDRMPQKAKRLAPEDIEAIRKWIESGADFGS